MYNSSLSPMEQLMIMENQRNIEREQQSMNQTGKGIDTLNGVLNSPSPSYDILIPNKSGQDKQQKNNGGLFNEAKLAVMDNSPDFIADIIRPEHFDTQDTKSWYEADISRQIDGKTFRTASTEPSELSTNEALDKMNNEIATNKSTDEKDSFIYGYRITDIYGKEQVKFGVAKNGFDDRYKDNPYLLQNADLFLNERVANAHQIEREWNGAKGVRESKLNQWGDDSSKVFSGAQEVLDYDKIITDLKEEASATHNSVQRAMIEPEEAKKVELELSSKIKKYNDVADLFEKKDEESGWFGGFSPTGTGTLDDLMKNDTINEMMRDVVSYNDDEDLTGKSDEEVRIMIQDFFSGETNNISQMIVRATKLYNDDPEAGMKYLSALKVYNSTDLTGEQFAKGIKETFKDITTYLSLGAGVVAKKVAAKKVMEKMLTEMTTSAAEKETLKRSVGKMAKEQVDNYITQNAVKVGVGAGAIEGGIYAGVEAGSREAIATQAYSKDYDWSVPLAGTAVGAALGGTLGGAVMLAFKKLFMKDGANEEEATVIAERKTKEFEELDKEKQKEFLESIDESTQEEIVNFLQKQESDYKAGEEFDTSEIQKKRPDEQKQVAEARIGQEGVLQRAKRPEFEPIDEDTGEVIKQKMSEDFINPVAKGGTSERTVEADAISTKSGEAQSVQSYDVPMKKGENPEKYLMRLIGAYDKNEKQVEKLGGLRGIQKERDTRTPAEKKAHREDFIIEQTDRMINSGTLKPEAEETFKKFLKLKVKERKEITNVGNIAKIKQEAEDKYYAQEEFKINEPSESWIKKNNEKNVKFLGEIENTDNIDILNVVKKNMENSETETKKAIDESVKRSGGRWNKVDLDKLKNSKDKKTQLLVDNYWARKNDIMLYNNEKINDEELTTRELNRLAKNKYGLNFTEGTIEELKAKAEEVALKLEELGQYKKAESMRIIKFNNFNRDNQSKSPKKNEWTENKKKIKEDEHKDSQTSSRIAHRQNIEKYIEREKKGFSNETNVFEIGKLGDDTISEFVREAVAAGIPAKTIAKISFPMNARTEKESKTLSILARAKLSKRINNIKAKKLKLKRPKTLESNRVLMPQRTVSDAKASNAQIIGGLLKSKNMLNLTNLGEDTSKELRAEIGKLIQKNSKEFSGIDKEFVKKTFVPRGYSQGRESAIEQIMLSENWDKEKATRYMDEYDKAYHEVVPEMEMLNDIVRRLVAEKKFGTKVKFNTLDGTEINLDLSKVVDGTIGRDIKTKVRLNEADAFSSKILPAIIQSIDASIMRSANKVGIKGKHDATFENSIAQQKLTKKIYNDNIKAIYDSSLLDDIFKQMGYDEGSVVAKIQRETGYEIATGADVFGKHATGTEMKKGEPFISEKSTKFNDDRIRTEKDLIREQLVKGNPFRQEADALITNLVNQSGHTDRSKVSVDDSVIEQLFAISHQSNTLTSDRLNDIMNKLGSTDNKVRNEIAETFEEIRAKLEYNPATKNKIKGEFRFVSKFKYRDKEGVPTKTYDEIFNSVQEELRENWTSLSPSARDLLMDKNKISKFKIIKAIETGNIKQLTPEEIVAKVEIEKLAKKKTWFTNKYGFRQAQDTPEMKEFNELDKKKRTAVKRIVQSEKMTRDALAKSFKNDGIDEEEFTKKILNSGYMLIKGFPEKFITQLMKDNTGLYKVAEKYIKQSALALGNKSEQGGYFRNNSEQIVDELNLDRQKGKTAKILDIMIALERLTKEDIDYAKANKNKESFIMAMDIMDNEKEISKNLFIGEKGNRNRMFMKEVYTGFKNIDGTWKTDKNWQEGMIPLDKEQLTVGARVERIPPSTVKTKQDLLEWAQENKLIIKDNGFFEVVNYEQKIKTGMSLKASAIISKTFESTKLKEASRETIKDIQEKMRTSNNLFSTEKLDGFVTVSADIKKRLPKELKKIEYINKDFALAITGKHDARLTDENSRRTLQIVDRLWKDLVLKGKQNVVIKNLSSYKNALLMGVSIGMSTGQLPTTVIKNMYKSMSERKKIQSLLKTKSELEARGKSTEEIDGKLNEFLLYRLENYGLSSNMIDGVVDDGTLLDNMLGSKMPEWINSLVGNIMMNQNRTTGRFLGGLFSEIDTASRYALAVNYMSKKGGGLSEAEAATKSNAPFADMEQIAPDMIDVIDEYGIVPFMKWFTQSAPGIAEIAMKNKTATMTTAIAIYIMGQQFNTATSGYNPTEGMIDFAEGITSKPSDTYQKITAERDGQLERTLLPMIIPSLYTKPYFKMKYKDELSKQDMVRILMPKKPGLWHEEEYGKLLPHDMRGITQVVVEDIFGVKNANEKK